MHVHRVRDKFVLCSHGTTLTIWKFRCLAIRKSECPNQAQIFSCRSKKPDRCCVNTMTVQIILSLYSKNEVEWMWGNSAGRHCFGFAQVGCMGKWWNHWIKLKCNPVHDFTFVWTEQKYNLNGFVWIKFTVQSKFSAGQKFIWYHANWGHFLRITGIFEKAVLSLEALLWLPWPVFKLSCNGIRKPTCLGWTRGIFQDDFWRPKWHKWYIQWNKGT